MRRAFLAGIATFAIGDLAASQDTPVPLNTYIVSSNAQLVYVFKRCSAISLLMSIKFQRVDTAGNKKKGLEMSAELMKRYNRFSELAFNIQNIIAKDNGEQITAAMIDTIFNDVNDMVAIYKADDDKAYQLQGKTISDLAFSDSEYCALLTKSEWYGK